MPKPVGRFAAWDGGDFARNPFYVGIMKLTTTGEGFKGRHEPLVTKEQFERIQHIMEGRVFDRPQAHQFIFRRVIRHGCGRTLTGEHHGWQQAANALNGCLGSHFIICIRPNSRRSRHRIRHRVQIPTSTQFGHAPPAELYRRGGSPSARRCALRADGGVEMVISHHTWPVLAMALLAVDRLNVFAPGVSTMV